MLKTTVRMRALGLMFVLCVTACGQSRATAPNANEVFTADGGRVKFRVETVVSNLNVPWTICFAPDGRMFFTERYGVVSIYENGKLHDRPLVTISDLEESGESGLMGMALHPKFSENHLLYFAYAYDSKDGKRVRVIRFREVDNNVTERKTIIENIPAAKYHAGTRLRFGQDGKLYITTGDATDRELAQRLDRLNGKTLRLNDDGSIPPDNPFVGQPNARGEIYSYGHRNAQGIDFQPETGMQVQTEHGPSFPLDGLRGGDDEVNVIERGKNYGWNKIRGSKTREGIESPVALYKSAIAPASGAFYRMATSGETAFPQFRGNYFFGALKGKMIVRLIFDGKKVTGQEKLLENRFGRIREVAVAPDGTIYFSTSNRDGRGDAAREDDRIMRIVPVK